jgi:sulfur carrier protein
MQILVNNEPRETRVHTLTQLLRELGLEAAVVATAVNGSFVPAGRRPTVELKEADRVEVLAPMQGG